MSNCNTEMFVLAAPLTRAEWDKMQISISFYLYSDDSNMNYQLKRIKRLYMTWIITSYNLEMYYIWCGEKTHIPFIILHGQPTTQIGNRVPLVSSILPQGKYAGCVLHLTVLPPNHPDLLITFQIHISGDIQWCAHTECWWHSINKQREKDTQLTWPCCVLAVCFRKSKSLPFRCFCGRTATHSYLQLLQS